MTPATEDSLELPVSVCIIAYNEEDKILRCLQSVSLFTDIVLVIDSKTTDRTGAIAEDFGCRVYVEDWKGDGPQKQSAIDKCRYEWIFLLDADEILPEESFQMIRDALLHKEDNVAFSLRRRSYIGSRRIRHSGWWPDRVTRLFNKTRCRMRGITHSSLQVNGRMSALEAVIVHYSYINYAHMADKMNRYSTWMANELYLTDKRVSCLTPWLHGTWMFFRTFFIKRGFLDGLDGLVISVVSATGSFLKYAKILELRREKKD